MRLDLVIPLILGWLSGWLVNYVADTLPATRSLSAPACAQCGHTYRLLDYLLFRPCPSCGHSRGLRPWIMQLALVAFSVYIWLEPARLGYALGFLLVTYLAIIVIIDIEHRLILHMTSIVGAVLGLGLGIRLHGLTMTVVGGLAGFGTMFLFYVLGEVFVRYMSKRRGEQIEEVALGYGDVNLAGIVGLLLGWPGIVIGLLFTILAGGVASLIVIVVMLLRRRYQAFSAIPYGPFLALSILLLLRP